MKKTTYFNDREVADLLKTFSKQDLKEFAGFLKYKGTSTFERFWELLRKKYPDFKIQDNTLFKHLRPGEKYNDSKFRRLVSELYALARDYVSYKEFEQNKHLYANTMAYSMLKYGAKRPCEKVLRDNEQLYNKQRPKNSHYYHYLHGHEDVKYQFNAVFKHHSADFSLHGLSDSHDQSFLMLKLKYLVAMRNHQRIISQAYNYENEQDFLRYLASFDLEKYPLIQLYYLLLQLFGNLADQALFKKAVAHFKQHKSSIAEVECRQFLNQATNICFWNICEGHLEYLKYRFDLTKIIVEEAYALVAQKFPSYNFRNTMRSAIEANELDWAASFLQKYLPKTSENDRPNLETLNRAYLHFAEGQYALQAKYMDQMAIMDYKFVDKYNDIAHRILRLKTNFVLLTPEPKAKVLQALKAQLESFRSYLGRQENIPDSIITSYQNFRLGLSLLLQSKYGDKSVGNDLKGQLLEMQPMVELPWLLGEL